MSEYSSHKSLNEKDINEMKEDPWYLKDPNEEADSMHKAINLSDLIKIE